MSDSAAVSARNARIGAVYCEVELRRAGEIGVLERDFFDGNGPAC